MRFKIHNDKYEDYFIIEEDTEEKIVESAMIEIEKRNWDRNDCWSDRI